MKKHALAIGVTFFLLSGCLGIAPAAIENATMSQDVQVTLTSSQVIVNGNKVEFTAYNINGNNYFKLRDIAAALNGSAKQFDIRWDEANNTIELLTNEPYTPGGGEVSDSGGPGTLTTVLSSVKLLIDGVPAEITAYNINGNHFFKLRDLGKAINFSVSWDAVLNRISIDSSKIYPELTDESIYGKQAYAYVEYIQNNLDRRVVGTQREKDTVEFILAELEDAGYASDQLEIQRFSFITKEGVAYDSQNIIVSKHGKNAKVIVVGAHYDSIDTYGVDDNGSGIAVLLETANRLKDAELPYSLQFIFFGAEEVRPIGQGSFDYVNSLSDEERQNILLMINLDSLLAGDKQYLFGGKYQSNGNVTDLWAAEQTKEIADDLGLEMILLPAMDPSYDGPSDRSDHIHFRNLGIPYVFFWAGNMELLPIGDLRQTEALGKILHTENDNLYVINEFFEGRAQARLKNYALLLDVVLKNFTAA